MYKSLTDAASDLQITRQWVHQLINKGKLRVIKIAGRRVVIQDDLYTKVKKKRVYDIPTM